MRRSRSEDIDTGVVRAAVKGVVEAERFDDWLLEVPEKALISMVAPLEMLQFQYYLEPPLARQLVRAARVCCAAVEGDLDGCPEDMVDAFARLAAAVVV
jgi:hypothetical protein